MIDADEDTEEKHWRRVEGGTGCRINRWGLMESSGCKLSVGNICPFVHLLHLLTVYIQDNGQFV